jgi:simple sugar transport system ATP-binding protein
LYFDEGEGDKLNDYVIEMHQMQKSFGEVRAVKNGEMTLKKGEIHSLIGENGAGKSTMMKLLYGMYDFDGGEVKINGETVTKINPKLAIEKGIGMVHQEFMLVNELTVLENIILGFEPVKGIRIDFEAAKKTVQKYIEQYGMDIQLNKKISQISVGEAQRVEIIKILTRGANVIILDEPTAVLTPQETRRLFEILENLKKDGKSIVFISHKLNEVMEISDRISVMRQGEYMGTVEKKDTSQAELARMMIGREVFMNIEKTEAHAGKPVLQVEDLWTSGEKEISKIRGISLEVKAGEIVGIAGIDGNGQSELVEAITGLRKVEKGRVILDGKDITGLSVQKIRKAGLTHIPEDRNTRGLNRTLTISDNIIAVQHADRPFSKGITMDRAASEKYTEKLIERFDIRPASADLPASSLSGGNAQKVVVAREVSMDGKLLIASQPTRGVDVGAIESIRSILQEVKAKGLGVLLISADLEEILSLSDRILVMFEGKITGSMRAEEADEEKLGLLMMSGSNGKGEAS